MHAQCYKYCLLAVHVWKNLEHPNTMLTRLPCQHACVTMSHMNTMHVIMVTAMVMAQCML